MNNEIIEILEKVIKKITALQVRLNSLDKQHVEEEINNLIKYVNDLKNIHQVIMDLEEELKNTIDNRELNLIFNVHPINIKGKLFEINEELKSYLKGIISNFIIRETISLEERQEFFIHLSEKDYNGKSIIIGNQGILILCQHFNPFREELFNSNSRKVYHLPLYEITENFLNSLKFIDDFFRKIQYKNEIKISLKILGLSKWYYEYGTPLRKKKCVSEPKDDIYNTYNIKDITTNEIEILKDIIGVILLSYNLSRDKILTFYNRILNNRKTN